jgi:hypothetical protein
MTHEELLINFSYAYITSVRNEDYFNGYVILNIEEDDKKAQHLEF